MKTFQKLERWTTLAGFKEFLKYKAKELLHTEGFNKTLSAIAVYVLYIGLTLGQFIALILLLLSIVANMAGSTTPMLATLINPRLTLVERVKTITGFTGNIEIDRDDRDSEFLDCSDATLHWRPDLNTYVKGNAIWLKDGRRAGTIILKDAVSSFLGFEIKFSSSMQSGINTILSFKNSTGTLKYAIGDGDFKSIRYSFTDNKGLLQVMETTKLLVNIDETKEIGFKLNTLEKAESTLATGTVTYQDIYGQTHSQDLKDINITSPKQLYINIGLGIDARREGNTRNAHIELINCSIVQTEPSKLLNI